MAKYYYTNMISALATGQLSYRDALCEILKRLCDLENEQVDNQADWTETDTTSPSYIQNKPTVQEFQADWNEQNSTAYGFIQNKPNIPEQVNADWTETDTESKAYILNKPMVTTAETNTATLVPPTAGFGNTSVLRSNGQWSNEASETINWIGGIASTQVNNFKNIINQFQNQADWTETDSSSPSFIQNKPSLPSAQVQSNWTETDTSAVSYIQNKPGTTTANTTTGTLVPPTNGNASAAVLHANGAWDGVASNYLYWNNGIMAGQTAYFTNALAAYGLYPRTSWGRYTQCFAYLEALPSGANNVWGCTAIQTWIPGKWWHIKVWCIKSIANNSTVTTSFFSYGINLDCVIEHMDLTPEQFAIAYQQNRVYSSAKKIDGYQVDGDTDWFGRVNLTDTEIGGVAICTYNASASTGYDGVIRFGGYKYSGSSMILTDYPLAQQGIGAFEFDIFVNAAS